MTTTRGRMGLGLASGVGGTLFVLALGALLTVYSGAYNVAATEDHTSLVRWAFTTTLRTSVENRAESVDAPPRFTEAMIATGAGEYKAMCEQCHGGPGIERDAWASGMLPRPPELAKAADEWQPNEVFWLVKHGVKMTGMAAFGPTHDDETLWSITAFVMQLPGMTAREYAAFETKQAAGSH